MFFDTEFLRDGEIFLKLDRTAPAQPEKDWLPAYYFRICLKDGTEVGRCDLRVGHNRKTYIGGNIGYGVDGPYRGHHYAAKACRLLFALAEKHGMDYVIISCVPENTPSARTCLRCGGVLLETAAVPEDNEMYAEGKRWVNIYRFNLRKRGESMKNILLIGMMGCGKTTIGTLLAQRLKKPLVDTDQLIERQEGATIPELFESQGEPYFRSVEAGVAQALSLRGDLIIACGGGLPMQERAMAALKETGVVIWLDRDAGEIYDTEDMTSRPLARNGRAAFVALAERRRPVYEKWADLAVTDFTSPVTTAAKVYRALGAL